MYNMYSSASFSQVFLTFAFTFTVPCALSVYVYAAIPVRRLKKHGRWKKQNCQKEATEITALRFVVRHWYFSWILTIKNPTSDNYPRPVGEGEKISRVREGNHEKIYESRIQRKMWQNDSYQQYMMTGSCNPRPKETCWHIREIERSKKKKNKNKEISKKYLSQRPVATWMNQPSHMNVPIFLHSRIW
jgi:hypothetical protein